jgi:hypothetical protein
MGKSEKRNTIEIRPLSIKGKIRQGTRPCQLFPIINRAVHFLDI